MKKKSLILTNIKNLKTNEDIEYFSLGKWVEDKNLERCKHPIMKEVNSTDLKKIEKKTTIFYEYFLEKLSVSLNKIHHINKSKKEWELVIGNWLRLFIEIILARIHLLSRLNLNNYNEVHITEYEHLKPYNFISFNRAEFSRLVENSIGWNQYIFSKIVRYYKNKNSSKFITTHHKRQIEKKSRYKKISYLSDNLRKYLFKLSSYFASCFAIERRVIFSFSWLSIINIIRLSIKIGKVPIIYFQEENRVSIKRVNRKLRKKLFEDNFNDINTIKDQKILLTYLVTEQLPMCYLENWNFLKDELKVKKIPLAKLILAGNGSDNDDVFRLFISNNYKNLKYIIFQHGGVYGLSPTVYKGEFYEHRVADKWISWGWEKNNSKNVIPGFNLKNLNRKKIFDKKAKDILLPLPYFSNSPTRIASSEANQTLDSIFEIINNLKEEIRQHVKLRVFPDQSNKILINSMVNKNYISQEANFYDNLKVSRLHLSIVNATTYLESLNLNFPTIILFEKKYLYIRKSIYRDFMKLKEVGIFYENSDDLIAFINKNYFSIEKWWNGKKLQKVKNTFIHKYARYDTDWINKTSVLIKNEK